MEISIDIRKLGKKYENRWIFHDVNCTFSRDSRTAILGSNGSGKSTLLLSIAGYLIPNKGELIWSLDGKQIEEDSIYKYLSFAAPYIELPGDLTVSEILEHQGIFKPFIGGMTWEDALDKINLKAFPCRQIKNLSSGMRQRLKLGLAILADCPVLMLDEPCSNLDANAVEWYSEMISVYAEKKIIFVCSNEQKQEFSFCNDTLMIEKFKSVK